MRIPLVGIVLFLALTSQSGRPSPANQSVRRSDLTSVLANRRVWGTSFPVALRQMGGWAAIGETEVFMYRNRIVGSREFDRTDAERASATLTSAVASDQGRRAPSLERWWGTLAHTTCPDLAVRLRPRQQRVILEASGGDCQFLAKELTIDDVSAQVGPPESTARRVVPGSGDDRTEVLTLYQYAKGAIAFVESNFSYPSQSGKHRVIDRVLFDPVRVAKAVGAPE